MKKEEIGRILKKVLVTTNWCYENIEEYHRPPTQKILKLVEELEIIDEEMR